RIGRPWFRRHSRRGRWRRVRSWTWLRSRKGRGKAREIAWPRLTLNAHGNRGPSSGDEAVAKRVVHAGLHFDEPFALYMIYIVAGATVRARISVGARADADDRNRAVGAGQLGAQVAMLMAVQHQLAPHLAQQLL